MNLLGAFIACRLLQGEEAMPLERLVRRVSDPEWRIILASLMDAGRLERQAALDERLGMIDSAAFVREQIAMAQRHAEYLEEQAQKLLREPPGVTLAAAAAQLRTVTWLWAGWIPMGAVTMLIGNSGIGKSHMALRLAQSVIAGERWPDGQDGITNGHGGPLTRRVVWIDTEARYALLNERAERWGVPRDRIQWPIDPENRSKLTPNLLLDEPEHWQIIKTYLDDWRPMLTIVDSLSGGHDADENKESIKAIMRRVADLSSDLGIAFFVIHHTRKSREGEQVNVVSIERARGSGAHIQWPQSVIVLDKPDAEQDRLRLRVEKANLTVPPPALGVTIEDDGIECDSLAPNEPRMWTASDEARHLLEDRLASGYARVTELRAEAQARSIPWLAVQRMRKQLGLICLRVGEQGREGGGFWAWGRPARHDEEET